MKLKLSDWASIGEMIGTAAVVISLLFVVRSIDQNTRAVDAAERNNIWQAWRQTAVLPVINDAEFAAVNAKVLNSEPLTTVEQLQWDRYIGAQIDIWAQLFDLRSDELISQDFWKYWDDGFAEAWSDSHEAIWLRIRDAYDADFQMHVDSITR